MDVPNVDFKAPQPVAESLATVPENAAVVAVFGTAHDLDRLKDLERLEYLWISGVDEAAAGVLGRLQGLQRLVIHDLRIADITPLAGLSRLTELAVAGSPKLRSLAGIESLTGLRKLLLFDNCKYTTIEPLARLTKLETLCLEGGWSRPLRLDSLAPLQGLTGLKRLRLASVRVADKSLRPLHQLRALSDVFIAKTFGAAELRALGAALPDARGMFVDDFREAR
jgi:internalin A